MKEVTLTTGRKVPGDLWAATTPELKKLPQEDLTTLFRSVQHNGPSSKVLTTLLKDLVPHDQRLDTVTLSPPKKGKRRTIVTSENNHLKDISQRESYKKDAIIAIVRAVLHQRDGVVVLDPEKGKARTITPPPNLV